MCLQSRRPRFNSWVRKILWRRDRLPTLVFLGFPCGSGGKESTCNAGDLGLISGLGRSPGEGNSFPLQYSALENSMDYHPWVHKESDMTERPSLSLQVTLVKNSPANTGDLRDTVSIPGLRRSPGEGHGNPLQYSCLENPYGWRSLGATVHGVAKIWTQVND